jgi:hypothetical protein
LDSAPEKGAHQDQPRLDRLSKADIVGDQQVDTRHPQSFQKGDKLEVFDLDGTVERARDGQTLEWTLSVGVQEGRRGGPAGGTQHSVEVFGRHWLGGIHYREGRRF